MGDITVFEVLIGMKSGTLQLNKFYVTGVNVQLGAARGVLVPQHGTTLENYCRTES